MKRWRWVLCGGVFAFLCLTTWVAFAAYHHMGEADSPNVVSVYPDMKGTKLDNCALCHSGGQVVSGTKTVTYGSCQWCHYKYGLDASGDIDATLNQYGKDYRDYGRNEAALTAIEELDSDGDGYTNIVEIVANTYPGDNNDDPSKIPAPAVVYTRPQLEAMQQHKQFLHMNVTKSSGGDSYVQYSGVTMEELLRRAGIVSTATGIRVYAPDGFSYTHPLMPPANPDPKNVQYYVIGSYPSGTYYYSTEADMKLNPSYGWCDYSAPSCPGRKDGDPIIVEGGLRLLLGIMRDGVYLTPGVLNPDNKLDGEGPFRVIPPQVKPGPPDQASTSKIQNVIWPFDPNADHNAGAATRSTTIIKVDPLPLGTTDINTLEAGWSYIDQAKLVIYGAVVGSDSNGNGILDSEEGTDRTMDMDQDGVPDFEDPDTATFHDAYGNGKIRIHTAKGDLANVAVQKIEDIPIGQDTKPASFLFPYGAVKFDVAGLTPGEAVKVTLAFPEGTGCFAKYFQITSSGWEELPVQLSGGNAVTVTLTEGDSHVDSDRVANGIISHLGVLAVPSSTPSEIAFSPEADTFVGSSNLSVWVNWKKVQEKFANFGHSSGLAVERGFYYGGQGFSNWRGTLIGFDLECIPEGTEITEAELSLYHYTVWDEPISVHRMKQDWSELEATWYQPYKGTQSWYKGWSDGTNYAADATDMQRVTKQGWVSWDVTEDVRAFLDGDPNYGWFLRSAIMRGSDWTSTSFYSKETWHEELRPFLRVQLDDNSPVPR